MDAVLEPDAVDGVLDAEAGRREGGTREGGMREGGMNREGGPGDAAVDVSIDVQIDVPQDPAFTATELLGRPTDRSVTLHLVPRRTQEVYVEYGPSAASFPLRTDTRTATGGEPLVTVLPSLTPNTRYFYRVRHRDPGAPDFNARDAHTFTTQRARGTAFAFTVQADSHLDENSDYAVYLSALANIQRDQPDFHVDLGDTFMCEKHPGPFTPVVAHAPDLAAVDARYVFERSNFARVAHSAALFLVNGNHEGEQGWLLDGTPDNVAIWATLTRKRYFPNPEADAFYAASTDAEPLVGVRQAYYAFEWGDAQFIMLDPYWYERTNPNGDRWTWTLGATQYHWLERVLAGSTARFRFVFLHHLVGGFDQARGGVEAAPLYEWGGHNADGSDGFAAHRPGWSAPIHALLRDHHVTAVFHGHDHVYVHQELDGIAYQEVPQPSASNFASGPLLAMQGGYVSGVILGSSGHLRVSVTADTAVVDYVRATPPPGYRIPDGGLPTDHYVLRPR